MLQKLDVFQFSAEEGAAYYLGSLETTNLKNTGRKEKVQKSSNSECLLDILYNSDYGVNSGRGESGLYD
jgi:hypothetical protein